MLDKDMKELSKESLTGAPQKSIVKPELLNITKGMPIEGNPAAGAPSDGITPDQMAAIPQEATKASMPIEEASLPNLEKPAESKAMPIDDPSMKQPPLNAIPIDENGYNPNAHNGSFNFKVITGTKGYKPGE